MHLTQHLKAGELYIITIGVYPTNANIAHFLVKMPSTQLV